MLGVRATNWGWGQSWLLLVTIAMVSCQPLGKILSPIGSYKSVENSSNSLLLIETELVHLHQLSLGVGRGCSGEGGYLCYPSVHLNPVPSGLMCGVHTAPQYFPTISVKVWSLMPTFSVKARLRDFALRVCTVVVGHSLVLCILWPAAA